MKNFEDLHKMIRMLKCINIPVFSIHKGLYITLLTECTMITKEATGVVPNLSADEDVMTNIQRIIEAVVNGMFKDNDVEMMTAINLFHIKHHCITSMYAVQLLLSTNHSEYIRLLNLHQPTEVYYNLFHPFDRINRDEKGKVVSIETSICLYTA